MTKRKISIENKNVKRKKQLKQKGQVNPAISVNGNTVLHGTIIKVSGDGNCFFRVISLALFGIESKYKDIRDAVVQYICNRWDDWCHHIYHIHNLLDKSLYMNFMGSQREVPSLPGEIEMTVASQLNDLTLINHRQSGELVVVGSGAIPVNLLYTGLRDNGHHDFIDTTGVHVEHLTDKTTQLPKWSTLPNSNTDMYPNLNGHVANGLAVHGTGMSTNNIYEHALKYINDNLFDCS
ncbi:hypothetical protein HOLleu_42140 [Holothuria leucospilota]|uniref:OTU domain-containing protein n=1 Tax=Holothuria leucospilota TaxID=206669 RepID=A0A9Q1BBH2_HOLLE|nr:hypothetical protein HOLleu_42140 [Holothuria leucospilota]